MSTAMEIAGISPETIKKFIAKAGANAADKAAGAAATSEENVLSRWINVSPEMAARWLKSNFRNRPVSDDVVTAYARDMINGVWQPTHQGIAFNDRDELIDGQHRLLAVIKSRKTVRMLVTFGLRSKIEGSDMTTMDCVDRGRTRSVADQLKIQHGLKNGTQIQQVCSSIGHLCLGEKLRRPSVDQTLRIYKEFKTEMDFIIANRSKSMGLRSAGVLAGFAFALATQPGAVHERAIAKMFVSLVWGDDVKDGKKLDAFATLKKLHVFLTGENATLLLASMNRGIAELTVWAILCEVQMVKPAELAREPKEWNLGVEHFRAMNEARVKKIAAAFALPKIEPAPAPAAAARGEVGVQPAGEKLNSCECGKKYPGKKNCNGCPDCRKDFQAGHNRDKRIVANRKDYAFADAAE